MADALLNTTRMERVTLTIATEAASIRAQFVRSTLSQVVRFLLLGHGFLVAYATLWFEEDSPTLLADILLAAFITLLYSFLVATFALYTSVSS